MTSKTRPIAALFDLDGVLIDTEGLYSQFWQGMAQRYPGGYEPRDLALRIKGANLENILTNYFLDTSIHAEIESQLVEFQKSLCFELFPGAIDFLEQLQKAGIPCCLVTSSEEVKMRAFYSQHPDFQHHFKIIITGDMVTHSKPDPECYLKAAQLAGIDIADCVVFEDSLQGLDAAMTAGATVIGLTTTYPADKISHKAHAVIPCIEGFTVQHMIDIHCAITKTKSQKP